jgi:hypothetical protein
MHYNSLDQFLNERGEDLESMMRESMRTAVGVYADFSPEELTRQARYSAQQIITSLRQGNIDRPAARDDAEKWNAAGIPMADLRRSSLEMDTRLRAWTNRHLHEQPDLEAELLRRINNIFNGFRSTVTAVDLDDQIARFNAPKPKADR